jgi:ABC-2 type transport system ATP-binding protein
MSTGMRQKTALAAVLSVHAPVLILDEPTSNLDPTARSEVLAIVREAKAAGRTVLFSSHVLGEVEEVCDRVVILRRGQLVHEQAMNELRRQHRIQARLTGPLPAPPADLNGALRIARSDNNELVIETPGELAPLLGWLATLPLSEVRIEPVRLQGLYDEYHGSGKIAGTQSLR